MKNLLLAFLLALALMPAAFASDPSYSAVFADSHPYMKGANLYSWSSDGATWFALLPGTNRLKQLFELDSAKVDAAKVEAQLKAIPAGVAVAWNNLITVENASAMDFALPPGDEVSRIRSIAAGSHLELQIPGQMASSK